MQDGTGTERATYADLLAAIGALITNDGLPVPHSIFAGHEGEVTFQMRGGNPLHVEKWAAAAGLAKPEFEGKPYVDGDRTWRSYDAVGTFMGWWMRVWCSVDEETRCPKCGERLNEIAAGTVGHAIDEQDPCVPAGPESAWTEPGDAERTAQVEEDAAEGASYRAEEAAELAAEQAEQAEPLPHRVPAEDAVSGALARLERGETVLNSPGAEAIDEHRRKIENSSGPAFWGER